MKQSPLEIKIENEQLIISIGIETLGFAVTHSDLFGLDERTMPTITDAAEFAKAILHELAEEDDEGTTMVHEMLDKAAEDATEPGAEGIVFPDETYEEGTFRTR
jgi:hypothetical protein